MSYEEGKSQTARPQPYHSVGSETPAEREAKRLIADALDGGRDLVEMLTERVFGKEEA